MLRVAAVAAPQYESAALGKGVLKSPDPVSVFNAVRYAAGLAAHGIGAWGASNWSASRRARRDAVLLMNAFEDDLPAFDLLIESIRPNLLLLGAMSLCLPGATACARRAKDILGDRVCVVLGGWHATETIYADVAGRVTHHPGSPVRLMCERRIPPDFDLVVAGEGEHVIAWLGERIAALEARRIPPASIRAHLNGIAQVSGEFIVAWADELQPVAVAGAGGALDRDALLPPCELFGVRAAFDVFDGRRTAHVFSGTGRGCVFDCTFCSERFSATGPRLALAGSADRLFHQLSSAARVIAEDTPGSKASAFVEDSTLLAGSKQSLRRLVELLAESSLDVRFGAQLTIDQILARLDILRELKAVGLDYLFVGVETPDPRAIGGLSKDVMSAKDTWMHRTESVFEALNALGIKCGAAILFGLGEAREQRALLLAQLHAWRDVLGAPNPVSLNWAVQHPLKGGDGGCEYRYDRWGVPRGAWAEAFRDFGEASVLYPSAGQPAPELAEVEEVAMLYRLLHTDARVLAKV